MNEIKDLKKIIEEAKVSPELISHFLLISHNQVRNLIEGRTKVPRPKTLKDISAFCEDFHELQTFWQSILLEDLAKLKRAKKSLLQVARVAIGSFPLRVGQILEKKGLSIDERASLLAALVLKLKKDKDSHKTGLKELQVKLMRFGNTLQN
ncbi:MAG TPA: hypothetical protein VFG01_10420 [Acidobacteriota bacterium]|nr:hypothetical protein [Acidobacteriota bacterium]